jgi:hypothetical protein
LNLFEQLKVLRVRQAEIEQHNIDRLALAAHDVAGGTRARAIPNVFLPCSLSRREGRVMSRPPCESGLRRRLQALDHSGQRRRRVLRRAFFESDFVKLHH